jgi:Mrp family chromosome partitioning ATPase
VAAEKRDTVSAAQVAEQQAIADNLTKIKHKLLIISGKGGVGKSTVAINLAYGLAAHGRSVGILDTDIHGPDIPKMLGADDQQHQVSKDGRIQPLSVSGIRAVSLASFLPDKDAPIVWRGPLKMKAIQQFLSDVEWGSLDYLVIDSPPGTGDEPLSVCQHIPHIDGAIIVTTPQEVALLDSRKSVKFSQMLKVPVLGVLENMSGFACPYCGKRVDLFKVGGGETAARELGVPFLGRVPIDPNMVVEGDAGRPFIRDYSKTEAGLALEDIVRRVVERVESSDRRA